MSAEIEPSKALDETLHAFYRTNNAERAVFGFQHYLDSGDLGNQNVLHTFARIAMISAEARLGFERLRARQPHYVDRVLQGPTDPSFPRPSASELGPLDLDLLWSEFFVTGHSAPVLRIVSVLDGADLVRERLGRWLRDKSSGFWGKRAIAKYRPMLVRCQFPIDYDAGTISQGVDLDVHVALNAKSGNLKFSELPIELSTQELIHLSTKSAALWSLRTLSKEHKPVSEICALAAAQAGGVARRMLNVHIS